MNANSFGQVNRRHLLMAGGAAFLLAGCAGGSKPIQIYVLKPDLARNNSPGPPGAKVTWDLAVATPYAIASLNLERIALTRSASTLDYFADAAWTDRLPVLLQNSLIESFEASGRIASVSRDTAGLKTDFVLETEVRDFAAHYEAAVTAPDVVVAITAKLVALPERTIVGTLDSQQHAQADANNVPAIVAAFNAALGASLKQIVAWTLTAPPAALTAPPGPARHHHRRRRRKRARA